MNFRAMLLAAVAASTAFNAVAQGTQPAGSVPIMPNAQPAANPNDRPIPDVTIPEGFVQVRVNDNSIVLCDRNDEPWVRQAVATIKPPTRPTTMPADMVTRLAGNRAKLAADMQAQLILPDTKRIDELFDDKDNGLLPTLQRTSRVTPKVYFLVTTEAKLKDLVLAKWEPRRFVYISVTGRIEYSTEAELSETQPDRQSVLPVLYTDGAKDTTKLAATLVARVQASEAAVIDSIAKRAEYILVGRLMRFVGENIYLDKTTFATRDAEWIRVGVSGALSCKWASTILGTSREALVDKLTGEGQNILVSSNDVDLLAINSEDYKPEFRPIYGEAVRRKSTRLVADALAKAGDAAVPKIIDALRKNVPQRASEGVKIFQDATGIDLTTQLRKPKRP